jgi:hypothetical protein
MGKGRDETRRKEEKLQQLKKLDVEKPVYHCSLLACEVEKHSQYKWLYEWPHRLDTEELMM